jgi:hypothetical protein
MVELLFAGFANLGSHPEVEKAVENENNGHIAVFLRQHQFHSAHFSLFRSETKICLLMTFVLFENMEIDNPEVVSGVDINGLLSFSVGSHNIRLVEFLVGSATFSPSNFFLFVLFSFLSLQGSIQTQVLTNRQYT